MTEPHHMDRFAEAWADYLCAVYGHIWTSTSYRTGWAPPIGSECSRCHARKAQGSTFADHARYGVMGDPWVYLASPPRLITLVAPRRAAHGPSSRSRT